MTTARAGFGLQAATLHLLRDLREIGVASIDERVYVECALELANWRPGGRDAGVDEAAVRRAELMLRSPSPGLVINPDPEGTEANELRRLAHDPVAVAAIHASREARVTGERERAAARKSAVEPFRARLAVLASIRGQWTGAAAQRRREIAAEVVDDAGNVLCVPTFNFGREISVEFAYIPANLGAALAYCTLLLMDRARPSPGNSFASLICRCELPECGRFYLADRGEGSRKRPNYSYCTREHREAHDRVKARDRAARHRRKAR